MLLYIHVPFCRRKCRYCTFHSEVFTGEGSGWKIRSYVDTLFLEIAKWGDILGKKEIDTVFFGGGTPSLLPPKTINQILHKVKTSFKLSPTAEISLEANPESLNSRHIVREYLSAGINRISIGVQSLDDDILELLGRAHRAKEAVHSFVSAREAGCSNINLDLMWAMPGQSVREWLKQLDEIIKLKPDHLSCYGLTIEDGSPISSDLEAGIIKLPTEREQAGMFTQGAETLQEAGLMHYEISNFARIGFQCRHNLGYWEGQDYLGLGPSAASTLGNKRYTNSSSHKLWEKSVKSIKIPEPIEEIDSVTRVLELIMLRLRTSRGLRVKAYRELTGRDFFKDNQKLIHALHQNRLIRITHGYLRLTTNGMLVSNSILEALFENARLKLQEQEPQTTVNESLQSTQMLDTSKLVNLSMIEN